MSNDTGQDILRNASTLALPTGQKDVRKVCFSPSGRYLAVACNDGHVLLYCRHELCQCLKTHETTIWDVAWSPFEFGNVIASAGADCRVVIQKEDPITHQWVTLFVDSDNRAALKSLSFTKHPNAPPSVYQMNAIASCVGLFLAAACLDGSVSIYSLTADNNWTKQSFVAHPGGCYKVAWCVSASLPTEGADDSFELPRHKLATAGLDGCINIWSRPGVVEDRLRGHYRPVLDVSWSSQDRLASISDDGTVIQWTKTAASWTPQLFRAPPASHTINYSPADGNLLAVSTKDPLPIPVRIIHTK